MAACDPTVATLPLGFGRWPQLCWDARSQRASSSVSAQCSVNIKISAQPWGVSAGLSLKFSTTADITTATVEIQDIASVCPAACHKAGNYFIHFMYLESQ